MKVTCEVCGKKFRRIGRHMRKHQNGNGVSHNGNGRAPTPILDKEVTAIGSILSAFSELETEAGRQYVRERLE